MSSINNVNDFNELKNMIEDIISDSTYSELSRYISMLPKWYEREDGLYYYGISFINEYYIIIERLEKYNSEKIEELKHKIYNLYLQDDYTDTYFSYKEFITFSKLLNTTFPKYIYKKEGKTNNNQQTQSIKPSYPNAYEISKYKLNILRNILLQRQNYILSVQIDEINQSTESLKEILSEDKIYKLKDKINYYSKRNNEELKWKIRKV